MQTDGKLIGLGLTGGEVEWNAEGGWWGDLVIVGKPAGIVQLIAELELEVGWLIGGVEAVEEEVVDVTTVAGGAILGEVAEGIPCGLGIGGHDEPDGLLWG